MCFDAKYTDHAIFLVEKSILFLLMNRYIQEIQKKETKAKAKMNPFSFLDDDEDEDDKSSNDDKNSDEDKSSNADD